MSVKLVARVWLVVPSTQMEQYVKNAWLVLGYLATNNSRAMK